MYDRMLAVSTSETSITFYETTRLHTAKIRKYSSIHSHLYIQCYIGLPHATEEILLNKLGDRLATVSELRRFCVGVACIVVIVDFYRKKTIRFIVICEMSSLLATRERNSAPRSIFNWNFRVLLFEYFSNRVVGICQTCCLYYCLSLLIVLQLSVLPPTLSTESLSNDYYNSKPHQRKYVVTRKRWRI
jgi:hypothetical protein